MSAPALLLDLRAAGRAYLAPSDQVDSVELLRPEAPPVADARGMPVLVRALGPLLGQPAGGGPEPRHALVVRLRRRSVLLLVERVERLTDDMEVQPLAPMLRRRLAAPWVLGAVAAPDAPVLVLDLRRIAADVALGAA